MAHTWEGAASGARHPERGLSLQPRDSQPCRRLVQAESGCTPQQQHQAQHWAVTSNHNKTAAVRQRTLICGIYYQPGARLSTKNPLSHQILKAAHFAFKETEVQEEEVN